MADALCGPSNALQNFKRHTQGDRSLQQDRLIGPRPPVQGFRTHDPRAGSLDAEFHAFENAPALPFEESFESNHFAPQTHFQQPHASNWAGDFQQLRITDSPVPAQEFRNYAPMVKTTNGGWHTEFARQQYNGQSAVAQGKQAVYEQRQVPEYHSQMSFSGGFAPMTSYATHTTIQQPQEVIQTQNFDQMTGADWSQAFEEAFQDAFQDAQQAEQANIVQEEPSLLAESETQQMATDVPVEHIKIGSDAIDYVEMKDRTTEHEQQDANALARVAGELLHNVQHDSSEKFQNSQFLDLMRKIRDRQVEVRNNDFESTGADPSTAGFQSSIPATDQDLRTTSDPIQNQDTFVFPDMDPIYAPRHGDHVDYTFDSDQFPSQPRNQISDLHPGGKLYPEQSPPGTHVQMSGAVPVNTLLSEPNSSSRSASYVSSDQRPTA